MARPLRLEFEGAIYHLCARGNARQAIFRGEQDCACFIALLAESARRFDAAIFCFVLMGNHFHLVAQTRRANLGRWMHWLLVSYSVYFNRRHRSSGHLFQGRYKSFLVQEGDYLLALSRYVHLNAVRGVRLGRGNPVERRQRLRSHRWSSYAGYAGLKRQFPFVEEEMVLGELGPARRSERVEYRGFVEEGLLREIDNPFAAVKWQAALGDESFMQKLRDLVKGIDKKGSREVSTLRHLMPTIDLKKILQAVAKEYRVDQQRLLTAGERGLQARNVAMLLVWETGSKSLAEIGQLFGGLDYSAVAQRIRRLRLSDDALIARKLLARMSDV
jgi:putative transposase